MAESTSSGPPPLAPPSIDVRPLKASPKSEAPKMSAIGRLFGVFFSPKEAFADIARRPRWWIPVLISAIVGAGFIVAFSKHVGWEDTIRMFFDQGGQSAQMPAAQREQLIGTISRYAPYVAYVMPILSLISAFLTALILLVLFDALMGAQIGLNRMLGIVAHAQLPMAISGCLATLVMFLKDPEEFDIQNPLAFNPGAFLPQDSARWAKLLAGSFDVFSFWVMALMAVGVVAASKKKMQFGTAFVTILGAWLLYVLGRTALVALQGS